MKIQAIKSIALTAFCFSLPTLMLAAGPVSKTDPVAEAFPDWQGISEKSYIAGREICPSDLRHKVTLVVEVEPNEKLQDQFATAGALIWSLLPGSGVNWETHEPPRDRITLVSCWGGSKKREQVQEAMKAKNQTMVAALYGYWGGACAVYDGVTFEGAPDTAGKRPYLYVMGPGGKEPLFKGELNAATVKEAKAVIVRELQNISKRDVKWRPFYGTVAEPKYNTSLAKALEKGKTAKLAPLDPVAKVLLADVKSKDAEKAKEAQILFDAINQRRSDLLMRINLEVATCPHRAYYDIQELLKYWPAEKKRLEVAYSRIKSNPETEPLAKMFCKVMEWSKPEFSCKNSTEAKKIVQELGKMKKALEKLKESKSVSIQNGAILLELKVDELSNAMAASF